MNSINDLIISKLSKHDDLQAPNEKYAELLSFHDFLSYDRQVKKLISSKNDIEICLFAAYPRSSYYMCKYNNKIYQVITSPDSSIIYDIRLQILE